MKDFTAIIVAAGMGVRMGPRGRLMPKGLIEVGGSPMVAQSLDTLATVRLTGGGGCGPLRAGGCAGVVVGVGLGSQVAVTRRQKVPQLL